MKSTKKLLCYIAFFVLGLFAYVGQVYAADRWSGVSSDQIPSRYANMEYCVYNTGDVFSGWSSSKGIQNSNLYGNTSYILIYDDSANEIDFLGMDGTVHRTPNGSYAWGETTNGFLGAFTKVKMRVSFDSDLYNYMVDDRGIFSCNDLYFIEDNKNLEIYTSRESLSRELRYDNQILNEIEIVHGTHYGQSLVSQCEVGYRSLMSIANNYYDNNPRLLEAIAELSNSTLQAGDGQRAKQYFDEFLSLYNSTVSQLNNLNFSENRDGNGFYIGRCNRINDLEREFKKLKVALNAGYQLATEKYNKIKSEFDKMSNSGVQGLEQDLEALGQIQTGLSSAKSAWESYISNINLGQAITDISCEGLLGPALLDDISTVLTWIRIAVPILLIILGTTDFVKALLSDDQQETKKATSRFVKRCIIAVAIFFIPSIIMYIISFIDKIADVSCDIRLW